MKTWKTISRTTALDHSIYLKVEEHTIELPDGRVIERWPWVIARDFVNVMPVNDEGKLLVFRQGKYGFDGLSLAPIGGYLEPGETPEQAARRELREELGYEAGDLIPLTSTLMAPNLGFSTSNPFLAQGLKYVGHEASDDLEDQELLAFNLDEMAAALLNGEVRVTSWYASFSNALLWLRNERKGL